MVVTKRNFYVICLRVCLFFFSFSTCEQNSERSASTCKIVTCAWRILFYYTWWNENLRSYVSVSAFFFFLFFLTELGKVSLDMWNRYLKTCSIWLVLFSGIADCYPPRAQLGTIQADRRLAAKLKEIFRFLGHVTEADGGQTTENECVV